MICCAEAMLKVSFITSVTWWQMMHWICQRSFGRWTGLYLIRTSCQIWNVWYAMDDGTDEAEKPDEEIQLAPLVQLGTKDRFPRKAKWTSADEFFRGWHLEMLNYPLVIMKHGNGELHISRYDFPIETSILWGISQVTFDVTELVKSAKKGVSPGDAKDAFTPWAHPCGGPRPFDTRDFAQLTSATHCGLFEGCSTRDEAVAGHAHTGDGLFVSHWRPVLVIESKIL